MKRIRLGIAGLGHVAAHQLAALRALPSEYEVVATCDRDPSRADPSCGATFFHDVERMLSHGGLDAVLVSVPPTEHAAVTRAVLECGLPALVEKPLAVSVSEFDALANLADQHHTILHSAYHAAFARELEWFINEGEARLGLGPLSGIRCGFFDPYIVDDTLLVSARHLGGAWMDSGINALSVVRRLVGRIRVDALRRTRVSNVACSDIQATLDFSFAVGGGGQGGRGGQGLVDTNWTLGRNEKTTRLFFGSSDAQIVLNHSSQRAVLFDGGSERVVADFASQHPRLVAHYLGVFLDFHARFMRGESNRRLTRELLEILYCDSGNV
ncbi:MAG: Gfo/Idh/MocA family oxidoreductase [Polyangiaceae bacterium]|nr:Gfo/Idh/MocA family oxidoreductase [Polyangiaceae bacterium]